MLAVITASIVLLGLAYYVWSQSQQRRVSVEGIQFDGTPDRNYADMIMSDKFRNSLFIFNDNTSGYGNGGNACIRGQERALGIPTGHIEPGPNQSLGGFTSLAEAKTHIPSAIKDIRDYIQSCPEIERVFYCCDPKGLLGVGIFRAQLGQGEGPSILQYATDQIHSLGEYKGPDGPY